MNGQNYEDPAERTSYVTAEGGYLWNHGGPFETREELQEKFGDIVSEKLIEEVAEELEADGTDQWASANDDDYYDDGSQLDLFPFDLFADKPTVHYGSPQDVEIRERARAALQQLLAALDEPRPVGIGHNKPPEGIGDSENIEVLKHDTQNLLTEFERPSPSISLVKKFGAALKNAAFALTKWIGRKADLAIDTAIKTAVPSITGCRHCLQRAAAQSS